MGIRQLDKNSDRPLYRQLAALLAAKIQAGVYPPGSRLPSERELSEELNVSRITARQAIGTLMEDGLIYREQGRGTFVAEPRMRRLQGLTSFTEDMLARGFTPRSQVLTKEVREGNVDLRQSLHLQPGERLLYLARLRLADDKPIAIQTSHISLKLCPGLENEDFTDLSLFALLREKYHIHPAWTEADVQAFLATPEEASLLQIRSNAPLLMVRGKTYTESFEPIEIVRTCYVGTGLALYLGRQRIGGAR